MDNVAIVVDDLDAAVAFFTELGMEPEGKGQIEAPGRTARRTRRRPKRDRDDADPDGHSKLELTKYHAPAADARAGEPAANTLACIASCSLSTTSMTRRRLRAHGAELLGEVAQYESASCSCYLRAPPASSSPWPNRSADAACCGTATTLIGARGRSPVTTV